MESNYNYFYKTSKPYARWWWFASEIQKNDIKHQLNWVKENNFGGVEIAWVYPLNRKRFADNHDDIPYMPRQEWLSREWSEIVSYTKQYCDSIGLGCDFTFGTGWPFGDTQVPYEEATKIYNKPYSELKKTYFTVSWEYPERGYIIDHLNKEAFYHYAERMGSVRSLRKPLLVFTASQNDIKMDQEISKKEVKKRPEI